MNANVQYFNFNERYIIDGIKDEYKNWENKTQRNLKGATKVLIDSPTGTGKTSFILGKILQFAAQNDRDVLYLCNRSALNTQIHLSAQNMWTDEFEYYLMYMPQRYYITYQQPSSSSKVTITTYQSFLQLMQSPDSPYHNPQNLPYYVIADEAHFFIEDSLFNEYTRHIWDHLMYTFSTSVMIFMTATANDFKDVFIEQMQSGGIYHPHPDIYRAISKKDIRIYKNHYSGFSYKLLCFQKYEELIPKINDCRNDEKWLIFVNSKEVGRNLQTLISQLTNKSVRFITASSSKTKLWNKLILEERFGPDILIATKVIDNGINIKDSAVKHIVLPFCNESDMIQMLGRKRSAYLSQSFEEISVNNENLEEVRVYVEQPSIQMLNSKLQYLSTFIPYIDEFTNISWLGDPNEKESRMEIFKNNLWHKRASRVRKYFFKSDTGELFCNPFSFYKIKLTVAYYQELLSYLSPTEMHFNYVLKWLNSPVGSTINHLYSENCDTLFEFIREFKDKLIPKEDKELFYSAFQYYYKKECFKRFSEDENTWISSQSIKKEKKRRKFTINKSLKFLSLNYIIRKRNNHWILTNN